MSFKTIFFSLIFIFFLIVFQYSLVPFLGIYGLIPNVVLIFVCLWNFFEKKEEKSGIFIAIVSGIFLDVFFSPFLGISAAYFIFVSLFFKKSHQILRGSQESQPIFYFLPLFVFVLFFYFIFLKITFLFFDSFLWNFNLISLLTNIVYNTFIAIIFFFLFKKTWRYFNK